MSRPPPKPGCTTRSPLSERHLKIERFFLEGLSLAQIGQKVRMTPRAVRSALNRVVDVRSVEKVRAGLGR